MNLNNVTISGRLGNNPEVVAFENGSKITKFSIANNEYYKSKDGEQKTHTNWVMVVYPKELPSFLQNKVLKGEEVVIEGRLKVRSYENDDSKKYFTEVFANRIHINSKKNTDTEFPPEIIEE